MESGEQKRKPGGKVANVDLDFAAECKRKREELGATLESFWKTLGVAKSTGSRYESGERGIPEPTKRLYRTMYTAESSNALDKYGEDGRKLLQMMDDPAVADALLQKLLLRRKK